MSVRDTSIKAFRQAIAAGFYETHLNTLTACIVEVGPHTRREASITTRIEYCSVCAAANALVKKKILMDWRTKQNPKTNKTAHILELYDVNDLGPEQAKLL